MASKKDRELEVVQNLDDFLGTDLFGITICQYFGEGRSNGHGLGGIDVDAFVCGHRKHGLCV